ncbi:DUF6491 family protein [Brevundimonas sp. AAP58]|uniref:DUF6491 family protein n=1 Tax=Brevundimonas sp. AAP58 TaxID=1523422 RepID=UPI003514B7E6
MSSTAKVGLSASLCACLLAACATSNEQQAARSEAEALRLAEINARQGQAMNQICPGRSDGWRPLGNNSVLLEARGEWYMAELSGTCDPESAFAAIATRRGPGTSCLSRGDQVFTGPPRSGGRCVITALYEWDDEADASLPSATSPVAQ